LEVGSGRREEVGRVRGWGLGGGTTQAFYAHMNKRNFKKRKRKTSQCRELHSDQLGCTHAPVSQYPTRFGRVGNCQVSISVFPQGRSRLYSLPLTPLGGSLSVELSIERHVELRNLPQIHPLLKYTQVAYISKCNKTDMKCKYKLSGKCLSRMLKALDC
jgi:hypothetical protein